MKKIALVAITIILAGTLWGCAGGEEADKTAPTISGVSASDITRMSATISWTTDEPATGEVEYGLTTSYGSTALQLLPALMNSHSVTLSDLDENTTYHYRVKSKDESGNEAVSGDYTFTTAAPPNEAPDQPSNVSPADGASDVSLTPTLISSNFSDPDAGDTHAASQWQVTTTSGDYSSPIFDSGTDTSNLTSVSIPSDILTIDTTYYWHVRYQDEQDAWSEYSTETSFTTHDIVTFPDSSLEAAVREAIGKPEGDIHVHEVEGMTSLQAPNSSIGDIAGLEYCTNLAVLWLNGNQIGDISPIDNLVNLTDLRLHKNQIDDISSLSNLTSLDYLNLFDNQISDVNPLANLTNLSRLYLNDNQITDIAPLSNLTDLATLALGGNQIEDITPLANLTNLLELYLGINQIEDISALPNASGMMYLELHRNQISDITSLSNLTSLTYLILSENQISDVSPLSNLTALTYLDIGDNQIGDISTLSNLTSLTYLGLYRNQISDVSPISNLTSLTSLSLNGNQIDNVTPLSALVNLTTLYLNSNQLSGITPLSDLTSLTQLVLFQNQISDISPLEELTSLIQLDLRLNQITDIGPLEGLTSLTTLLLNNNQITDITPLSNLISLTRLWLHHNQISDIYPLLENEGLTEGDEVYLQGNPLSAESLCTLIPQLEARGVEVQYDEPLACVAYIYMSDTEGANSYEMFLEDNDYSVTLIPMSNVAVTDFSTYGLIIVGGDTEGWDDPVSVSAVDISANPIIGLGEGGYDFFGQLGLDTGRPYGWHGTKQTIYVVDTSHAIFNTPNLINIPEDDIIRLYITTDEVGIDLPTIPENVTVLGREADDLQHYPLTLENGRYLLWGFTASPASMTQEGKDLFLNVVDFMLGTS